MSARENLQRRNVPPYRFFNFVRTSWKRIRRVALDHELLVCKRMDEGNSPRMGGRISGNGMRENAALAFSLLHSLSRGSADVLSQRNAAGPDGVRSPGSSLRCRKLFQIVEHPVGRCRGAQDRRPRASAAVLAMVPSRGFIVPAHERRIRLSMTGPFDVLASPLHGSQCLSPLFCPRTEHDTGGFEVEPMHPPGVPGHPS